MEKKNSEHRLHLKPNYFLLHKQNLQKRLDKYEEDFAKKIREISERQKVLSSSLSSESESSVSISGKDGATKDQSEAGNITRRNLGRSKRQSSEGNSRINSGRSRNGSRRCEILPTKSSSFPEQSGFTTKRSTNFLDNLQNELEIPNRQKRILRRQQRIERLDLSASNLHENQKLSSSLESLSVNDEKDKHPTRLMAESQQSCQVNESIKPARRFTGTEESEETHTNIVQRKEQHLFRNTTHMPLLLRPKVNYQFTTHLNQESINKKTDIKSVHDISRTVLEHPMSNRLSRNTRSLGRISAQEKPVLGRIRSKTFSGEERNTNEPSADLNFHQQGQVIRNTKATLTKVKNQYLSHYHRNAWSESNEDDGEREDLTDDVSPEINNSGKQRLNRNHEDNAVKNQKVSHFTTVGESFASSGCEESEEIEIERHLAVNLKERDVSLLNNKVIQESAFEKDKCVKKHQNIDSQLQLHKSSHQGYDNKTKRENININPRRFSANHIQGHKPCTSANQIKEEKQEEVGKSPANQGQDKKRSTPANQNTEEIEKMDNVSNESTNQLQERTSSANQNKEEQLEEIDNVSIQSANELQERGPSANQNKEVIPDENTNLPLSKGWRKLQSIPLTRLQQLNHRQEHNQQQETLTARLRQLNHRQEHNEQQETLADFKDKSGHAGPGLMSFQQVVMAAIKREKDKKTNAERQKNLLRKERMTELQQPTESFLRQTMDKAVHHGYAPKPPSNQPPGAVHFRTVVKSLQGFRNLSEVVSGNRLKRAERIQQRSNASLPYTRTNELLSQEEKSVAERMADVKGSRYLRIKNSIGRENSS